MKNKKKIILAALFMSMFAGSIAVDASSSNDLIKMDIKKSSAADAVDVTFYTTEGSTNSVVTRKSDNRYVVLLPNVAGSSSVAPNIGGVKDLITNIDVKNVNDGIGGYTKVTFSTTKPVRIQTSVKKTTPLTKAQEDYKNLIAQNQNTKPAVQKTTQTVSTLQNKPTAKPAETKTTTPKPTVVNTMPVQNKIVNVATPKPAQQHQKSVEKPKVVSQPAPQPSANVVKKVEAPTKVVETPKITETVETPKVNNEVKNVETTAPAQKAPEVQKPQQVSDIKISNYLKENGSKYPLWMIVLASFLGLIVLRGIFAALFRKRNNNSQVDTMSAQKLEQTRQKLENIINDDSLDWQEKYNKYSQANVGAEDAKNNTDPSYVTDLSASKSAIFTPGYVEKNSAYKVNEITNTEDGIPALNNAKADSEICFKDLVKSINQPMMNNREEVLKEQLRARISQMEHSLAQTPKLELSDETKKEMYSEDDKVVNTIANVKLKSFAKHKILNENHRMLLGAEKIIATDKNLKEGRFVKLKNSPLNISRRKSASSILNDNTHFNNGEMDMSKNIDNYSLSSVNEYLSLLDSEETKSTARTNYASAAMSNPIKSGRMNAGSVNGMIVRSGYNIDSEKGFYIVDMDGASALIGKIKDNTFVLKKFDQKIDARIQVRRDYDSVYIVRVGSYKCLVDVSKNKMGTLVEI